MIFLTVLRFLEQIHAQNKRGGSLRKGFTLVELSIVLVIIGLLIGGILTAQSMINTAKISAQVRQIGQFDAMVLNFKEQYNYLPGDAPAFGGDGDGSIEENASTTDASTVFIGEIGNFWHDMDSTQFPGSAPFVNPGINPQSSGASKTVPEARIGVQKAFVVALALTIDSGYVDTANRRNFYSILNPAQAQTISPYCCYHFSATTSVNSAVSPIDALALDQKMDDGVANTGNVVSGSVGNYAGLGVGGIIAAPVAGICSLGAAYIVANSGYECTPLIRIGGSVGLPQ